MPPRLSRETHNARAVYNFNLQVVYDGNWLTCTAWSGGDGKRCQRESALGNNRASEEQAKVITRVLAEPRNRRLPPTLVTKNVREEFASEYL